MTAKVEVIKTTKVVLELADEEIDMLKIILANAEIPVLFIPSFQAKAFKFKQEFLECCKAPESVTTT